MRRLKSFIARFKQTLGKMHPPKLVLVGYLSYILAGWLLLCIPFLQTNQDVKALDNLFIATSAVSTTGLVPVSVSDRYNFAGQLVILLLIQVGGIGYMTFGSFVVLSGRRSLSKVREEIGKTVFSLPEGFRIDKFIKSVVRFTLLVELIGAVLLYFLFKKAGMPNTIWSAVFHSVSAFCTAGFSLYNDSFESFTGNFQVNLVIIALSYTGAVGFIVCVDLWRAIRGKIKSLTLTSKIILWTSFWLSLGGTLLLFVSEPSIQSKAPDERLMAAFFQAMTAMTTVGFNTVKIVGLSKASLLLIVVLMVIGASPSGTGGGLKSTTFSAMVGVVRSAFRGEKEVKFWGRPIPLERVWTAVASLGFYLTVLVVGIYILQMTESSALFVENVFEAASALGTVGLSMGITASLTDIGKLIVILLMFCGRLGPLTLATTLLFKKGFKGEQQDETQENDLAV